MPILSLEQRPSDGGIAALHRILRTMRPSHLVQADTLAILRQNQKQRKRPMPLLQNHIAVVTGAGSGIGRAIANGYAREGARVVLLDRDEKAAAEAAKEIRDAGGKCGQLCARRRQTRGLRRDGKTDRRQGRAGLDPGQQCRHRPPQRHAGRGRGRDQGLGRHHRDQPHGCFQRDACVPRTLARQQGSHRQHRLDPVLRACAHAELAGLHRLQARRARLHQGARRRTRQGRRPRQRDRPGLHRDAA